MGDVDATALIERRRQRNRESMRRVRMRKRASRESAQRTVERLERELQARVASSQRVADELRPVQSPTASSSVRAAYAEVLAQTAALSVTNQRLRAQVHAFQEAEAAVARIASEQREDQGEDGEGEGEDEDEPERWSGLSLRPLLAWLLQGDALEALVALATRHVVSSAERARLLVPHGNQVLGWDDRRVVDTHHVARYHLRKRFPSVRALPLFLKTWAATTDLKALAAIMRWANGMKVLRWLGRDAAIVARELEIPPASGAAAAELPTRFHFTLLVFRRRLPDHRGLLIGTSNLNIYGSSPDECLAKDASLHLGVHARTQYGWFFRPLLAQPEGDEVGVEVTLAGLTANGHGAYAHNVLMEMITVVLLWENALVGPILSLPPSD